MSTEPLPAGGRTLPNLASRAVLTDGGSSLRDDRQVDGELRYFQHSFSV